MSGGLILCALLLQPAADAGSVSTVLAPEGRPNVIMADDFDGDGDLDLVTVDGRRVSVFFLENGRLPSRPSLAPLLPEDVVFVDGGDVDGDRARELLLLTPGGVLALGFPGGAVSGPAPVPGLAVEDALLFPVPDADVCWNDVFLDVDGSGREDALVPAARGCRVFLRSGDATSFTDGGLIPIAPAGAIEFPRGSDLGAIEQSVAMPRVFSGDLDGDGRNEVLTFDGRAVAAYEQPRAPGGTWSRRFSKVLYDATPSLREEILSSRSVRFSDLDGRGQSCLLVVRALDGEVDFLDGAALENRRTLRFEGWVLPPKLIDLDGDGRTDLLVPTIEEVDHLKLMRIFVARSLRMSYSIFRNREGVRYARTPDEVREITFPLDYASLGGGFSVANQMIYTFDGDFDGDGVKDFLVKRSPAELAVHRGGGDASFAREATRLLDIEDSAPFLSVDARCWDFDQDGRDDLFLHYVARAGEEDRYVVRMTRG
ncbi:MAG: VCBS repeat-containing protein [Planctomycetes bacterium]|nr:VCBS repeat-containing protein [Planctomycetota bacterium]